MWRYLKSWWSKVFIQTGIQKGMWIWKEVSDKLPGFKRNLCLYISI